MFDRHHPVILLIYKSIGHLSWPTSAINFFDQYRWIMFFCRRWLMHSSACKWKRCRCRRKHNFGWARTKNLADLLSKFFRQTQQKRILNRKKILSASVCKKNCAMSVEKYQSRLHNDRCRLLYFLFNRWQIFGWCLLGNVRWSSPGDATFLKIDPHHSWPTSASIFFDQYRWIMFFCRRWLMFSSASKWNRCRCRRKHNFGWARTKKPSRPTL